MRAGEQVDLLRAPDRGRGQVLVDAGLEHDVVLLEELLGAPQRLVEPAQRRAAVAGDEAGGVQPRREVALALHHRQKNAIMGGLGPGPPIDFCPSARNSMKPYLLGAPGQLGLAADRAVPA